MMHQKVEAAGAIFRPHFKTHQSGFVGNFFKEQGITKITVSSVQMAHYFAQHGWKDITIAFPFNIRETFKINELQRISKITLITASTEVLRYLQKHLTQPANILLKVDTGAQRSGIQATDFDRTDHFVEIATASELTHFAGFLTHAGHTYHARGLSEIQSIANQGHAQLEALKNRYGSAYVTSWGDTPSCATAQMNGWFDEWRPGNFVFFDLMQYHIGSCSLADVAVAVACPVVEVQQQRQRLIIHGGAVHFSKEFIEADHGFRLYGYVVRFTEDGWTAPVAGAWLSSVSQEHGVVETGGHLRDVHPGDIIGILPVHSCLAVSAMQQMLTTRGERVPCMKP